MDSHNEDFLRELGIAPWTGVLAATKSGGRERSDALLTEYAPRLFSAEPYSKVFEVMSGGRLYASLRLKRRAPSWEQFGLFPGSELRIVLSKRTPKDGELFLHAERRRVALGRYEQAQYDPLVQVPDSVTGHLWPGFAIVEALGPNVVPKLEVGSHVMLARGLNGVPKGARVVKATSRSYHFRFTRASRRTTMCVTFREIRDGQIRVTIATREDSAFLAAVGIAAADDMQS